MPLTSHLLLLPTLTLLPKLSHHNRYQNRPTPLNLYAFHRDECNRRTITPTANRATPIGDLTLDPTTPCLPAVGINLRHPTKRTRAAAVSETNISKLIPILQRTGAFSLELWLRAAPSPRGANAAAPILAIGGPDSGVPGACERGELSLLVAQAGDYIEFSVARAISFHQRLFCFRAEVDGADGGGGLLLGPLTPGEADGGGVSHRDESLGPPRQLVFAVERGQPLRAYLDGELLPQPLLLPSYRPADFALEPTFDWDAGHTLQLAPLASTAHGDAAWTGDILLVAMYDSALSADQVRSAHEAWLADSAPLVVDRNATVVEDSPTELLLSATDAFDAAYSPRASPPILLFVASLPARGELLRTANSSVPVTADELPLPLPTGRVWYAPPRDLASPSASLAADSFEYFASQTGPVERRDSELATLSIFIRPENDPPVTLAAQFDVDAEGLAVLHLAAEDVDSPLGDAVLLSLPGHGRLYGRWQGAPSAALAVGARLPPGEWALVFSFGGEVGGDVWPAERAGELVVATDEFRFAACDDSGLCDPVGAAATLRVLNTLRATPMRTELREDSVATLRLGATRRDGAPVGQLHYYVHQLPRQHGSLFSCGAGLGDGCDCAEPTTRNASVCEALGVGERVEAGLVWYEPAHDYFGIDAFAFEVRDERGRRSPPAEVTLTVSGRADAPRVRGEPSLAAAMSAEALAPAPLPPLNLVDPDGDGAAWGVELSCEHGFLTLNETVLPRLFFELGDGVSDRSMFFSGVPSAVSAAFEGATYRAIDVRNDTVSLVVSDAHGGGTTTSARGARLAVVDVRVHASAAARAQVSRRAPLSAIIATWSTIGALLLLCSISFFGWLQRSCHPEELEQRAAELYDELRDIERESEVLRGLPPGGGGGGGDDDDVADSEASKPTSLRGWALDAKQQRRRARLGSRRRSSGDDDRDGLRGSSGSGGVDWVRTPSEESRATPAAARSPISEVASPGSAARPAVTTRMLEVVFGTRRGHTPGDTHNARVAGESSDTIVML